MLSLAAKTGILVGTLLLAFIVWKGVSVLLTDLMLWPGKANRKARDEGTGSIPAEVDPIDTVPGLHVVSDFEGRHEFIDGQPDEALIRETVRRLDWVDGFHHVVLVTAPGEYLEVSGSLNPEHGLSSSYRHDERKLHWVSREPPESVAQMEDLLVSFSLGDGRWERMLHYD